MNLKEMLEMYNLPRNGVLHFGGTGEEVDMYRELGFRHVLFVQPNPAQYEAMLKRIAGMQNFAAAVRIKVGGDNQYVSTNGLLTPQFTLDTMLVAVGIHPKEFNVMMMSDLAELPAREWIEESKTVKYLDLIGDEILRPAQINLFQDGNIRFGNAIFQYFFARRYARAHQIVTLHSRPWDGQLIFGLNDPPLENALPKREEHSQNPHLVTLEKGIRDPFHASAPVGNFSLGGVFQYDTEYFNEIDRSLFKIIFKPVQALSNALELALEEKIRGKTLIALHVRRGDYATDYPGHPMFYATPTEVYKAWLNDIWNAVENPVIYIATDDPKVVDEFAEFEPLSAKDLPVKVPAAYYVDFWVLTQAKYVAISNSSFSFAATMLNETCTDCYRPTKDGKMLPYDPWNSPVLLGREEADEFNPSSQSEAVCLGIMLQAMIQADELRIGRFIEVGMGTFGWYSVTMKGQSFMPYIVEPMPVPNLRAASENNQIPLEEAVLAVCDGELYLYPGRGPDLNSLDPKWWGVKEGEPGVKVKAMTYASFVKKHGIEKVTGLKLDVEGAEWQILSTLKDAPEELLPKVIMFEYGGGARKKNEGGWTENNLALLNDNFRELKRLGYNRAVIVENHRDPVETTLDAMLAADPFAADATYGNIIVAR